MYVTQTPNKGLLVHVLPPAKVSIIFDALEEHYHCKMNVWDKINPTEIWECLEGRGGTSVPAVRIALLQNLISRYVSHLSITQT